MNEQDDVIFEEDGEEGNPALVIKKLRERLKKAEAEKEEYLTGWQKERADSVNVRKRVEEDRQHFAKFANEGLIMEILPALDSFDMAFANKESWEKLPKEWTKGVEYIYSQLLSALEANGVKRIYPLNETFDPNRDEALATLEVESEKDNNKILEVVQPGYLFNGKIVRTTKVKVGEYKQN